MVWGGKEVNENSTYDRNYQNLSVEAFKFSEGKKKRCVEYTFYNVEMDGYTIINASNEDFSTSEVKRIPGWIKLEDELTQGELDDINTAVVTTNLLRSRYQKHLKSVKIDLNRRNGEK